MIPVVDVVDFYLFCYLGQDSRRGTIRLALRFAIEFVSSYLGSALRNILKLDVSSSNLVLWFSKPLPDDATQFFKDSEFYAPDVMLRSGVLLD